MSRSRSARRPVLLALALVVVLAGALGLRWINRATAPAPRTEPGPTAPLRWEGPSPGGAVPAPQPAGPADLAHPDWSPRHASDDRAIDFTVDLDLIAPLGDGPENAALWLADFARYDGARRDELSQASHRRDVALDTPGLLAPELHRRLHGEWRVLLPDDPLVVEAEPWADQATMRFYPDVWTADGYQTPVPDLRLPIQLARTWVLRGDLEEDPAAAFEDYRRAIRLGRLLRQEDAVILTDLVGLGCIEVGLRAIYSRLLENGRIEEALVVSLALGEVASQRSASADRFALVDLTGYIRTGWRSTRVEISDPDFEVLLAVAERNPDRRFRLEAIFTLNLVHFHGTGAQRDRTTALLDGLAEDSDEIVAAAAALSRDRRPDLGQFEGAAHG